LSHGTNDAQKTMGVIALALITTGHLTGDVKAQGLPFWIIFSCALAIGLGTYIGGWRVIRTLGKGLVEIESPQGFAAEASSAAVAWLITLPAAGLVGALSYWLSDSVKSLTDSALAGDGLILVLCALSGYMWWRAQQQKVDHKNVNADWDDSTNSLAPADVREAANAPKDTAAV
jgi:inorganic phosphate transporter, PiT family